MVGFFTNYTINGETKTLLDWCEGDRKKARRAKLRLSKGGDWTPEAAINTPSMSFSDAGKKSSMKSGWRESNKQFFKGAH